jgi:hypothetical protein
MYPERKRGSSEFWQMVMGENIRLPTENAISRGQEPPELARKNCEKNPVGGT